MTAYYRHDGFAYRHPGERGDFDRLREMEIWNGREWEPVASHDARALAMWEGMPMDEGEAAAMTESED